MASNDSIEIIKEHLLKEGHIELLSAVLGFVLGREKIDFTKYEIYKINNGFDVVICDPTREHVFTGLKNGENISVNYRFTFFEKDEILNDYVGLEVEILEKGTKRT